MEIEEVRLHGLDLFSGIGGNTLGLREHIKTIAYCEADRHAQSVLLSRMGDGSIEPAPIWDNITTLTGQHFDVPIDIIVGGFPCQDISVAGRGEGIVEGNRSGLFYQIVRLAKEIKPSFLFLENVPAIRTRGLDTVIQELTEIGYDLRWTMLSAADVGANHKRERWFLLAHAKSGNDRSRFFEESERQVQQLGVSFISDNVSNSDCFELRLKQRRSSGQDGKSETVSRYDGQEELVADTSGRTQTELNDISDNSWWKSEPDVGRVANGVSLRVDRIKRLGNAVVPLQAKTAFEMLMGISK